MEESAPSSAQNTPEEIKIAAPKQAVIAAWKQAIEVD